MANGKKAALAALKGFGVFAGYFLLQNVAMFAGQFIAGRELAKSNPGKVFSQEELTQFAAEFNGKNSAWFIVAATVAMLLIMLIVSLIRKKRFGEMTGMEKTSSKKALAGALIGFGASPLVLSIISLLPESLLSTYSESSAALAGASLIPTILGPVICAPIIEEIICRGLIFRGMRKHASFTPSLIVSSVIFALAHSLSGFSIVWVTYTLALGLILGIVCEKTDSIIPSICLHIAFNIYGTIISSLIAPYMNIAVVAVQAVAGAALLAGGFFLLRRRERVSNAVKFETAD